MKPWRALHGMLGSFGRSRGYVTLAIHSGPLSRTDLAVARLKNTLALVRGHDEAGPAPRDWPRRAYRCS